MKKVTLMNIIYIALILYSCSNSGVNLQDSNITLREGEEQTVKMNQDSLIIKLVKVTPIFSEIVVDKNGSNTLHKVYDAVISVDQQDLTFRSYISSTDDQVRAEKTWEQLKETYQGIKLYKSYQIGISDIYSEGDPGAGGQYFSKVLIKK